MDIAGTKGSELAGKKIALCICGSIACVCSTEIARELRRHGAEVHTVMSEAACELMNPELMVWATRQKVVTKLAGMLEHVELAGAHEEKVDLVLVAPATANTIGKAANGIDDTPVTTLLTTAIGSKIPIIFVPAMHISMYEHPQVMENIKKLEKIGCEFMLPRIEEGRAKIAETEDIVDYAIKAVCKKDLKGKKIAVNAGATREFFDEVRFISNPSTGKMGIALAREAWLRGADVKLYAGHIEARIPSYLEVVKAENLEEMAKIRNEKADIALLAAAPADFSVKKAKGKLASDKKVSLELTPAQKICERMNAKKVIIFKAETNLDDSKLAEIAEKRMKECGAEMVVANDVSRKGAGFAQDTNEVLIISSKGKRKIVGNKTKVAMEILDSL